ncbi:MAG: site-2 protease family protein [Anaerolineae bacterium]|nr:site-2 protease family protein [Anaerolineae bacterium]
MLLGGNLSIEGLIINLVVLLIGMTLHEFAHNYIGWRMGDPTPAQQGRLTLNPFVHINWVGWLMFALIGFGILGSAPISPYRMPQENRRWRWLAAVAAGPLSNLILAAIFGLVIRLMGQTLFNLPDIFTNFLIQMVYLNVLLAVFNLLPLYPIDGWQIVYALLPPELAVKWEQYRNVSTYAFFALLLLSLLRIPGVPNLLSALISQPTIAITRLLIGG